MSRGNTDVGLYYTLCGGNIKETKLTKKEITLLESINQVNENEATAILSLMKTYYDNNSSDEELLNEEEKIIPFMGRQLLNGVEFEIKNLPPVLGRIIIKFLKLIRQ